MPLVRHLIFAATFVFSFALIQPALSNSGFAGWVNSTLNKAHKTGQAVGKKVNDAVPQDIKDGAKKTGEGIVDTSQAIGRAAEPVLRDAVEGTIKLIEKLHR